MTSFAISGVNGIADLTLSLTTPGVYRMRGRNGAGKTSAIHAVRAALGDRTATAQPTDGLSAGSVTGPGVTLKVGRHKSRTGVPEVTLADSGPLATLIEPPYKGDAERGRARIQALLRLVPIEVTSAMINDLCGGNQALLERVTGKDGTDVLGYAHRAKIEAQALARQAEAQADEAKGAAAVADARLGEIGPVPEGTELSTEDDDRRAVQGATGALAIAEQSCRQRKELADRQAQVRATLGERPDVDGRRSELAVATAEVARLRAELATAQGSHLTAVERLKEAEVAAKSWDASARILELPLTGASVCDVEIAERELRVVTERVGLSAKLRARKQAIEAHAEAMRDHAAALERAALMRKISDRVPDVLGHALRHAGIPGLTVHEGKLAIRTESGILDWDSRLSFGQRVRFALQIALQAAQTGGTNVFALDPEFWLALDPEHKQAAHEIANELGVYLLTEEPSEGDLRMEPMETAK